MTYDMYIVFYNYPQGIYSTVEQAKEKLEELRKDIAINMKDVHVYGQNFGDVIMDYKNRIVL